MSEKILHLKLGDSLTNRDAEIILNQLEQAFEDSEYKILCTKGDDVDIEIQDPDVMSDIRKDLQEIKKVLLYPMMVISTEDIDIDNIDEQMFSQGGELIGPPAQKIKFYPYDYIKSEIDPDDVDKMSKAGTDE